MMISKLSLDVLLVEVLLVSTS